MSSQELNLLVLKGIGTRIRTVILIMRIVKGLWFRNHFIVLWYGWSRGGERRSWGQLYGHYRTGRAVVVTWIWTLLWASSRIE